MDKQSLACWPRLLDVHLAAQYLSVSSRTIEQWIADEILRPVAMPGMTRTLKLRRVLLDREDLDKLIADRKAQA